MLDKDACAHTHHQVHPDALDTQLRKGVLEYCVLGLLEDEPHYGYQLVQRLAQADGLLTSEGTIYPLLSRMRREGLVETEWRESSAGPPRRYYRLTREGEESLKRFRSSWTRFRKAVESVLGGVEVTDGRGSS